MERECQRNIEVSWLTGQLAPDFKTIADSRTDNGAAIRKVCREFIVLCRKLALLMASVAIDGSKFEAVNARDKNFTEAKTKRRLSALTRASHAISLNWKPQIATATLCRRRRSHDLRARSRSLD